MNYREMTDDQLDGALMLAEWLLSITPCKGPGQGVPTLNDQIKAIQLEQLSRPKATNK